jgi:hypothetical protein
LLKLNLLSSFVREKEQKKAFLVQEATDIVQVSSKKTWTFDRSVLTSVSDPNPENIEKAKI